MLFGYQSKSFANTSVNNLETSRRNIKRGSGKREYKIEQAKKWKRKRRGGCIEITVSKCLYVKNKSKN